MTRTIIFAAGLALSGALAASTAAFGQDANTIKDVEVKAELGDIKDANAMNFWPTMAEDLEAAILAKAEDRLADDGYEVVVSLKEVSLSGSTLLTGEGEFNRLEGWVYFIPEGTEVAEDQSDIIIEAVTAPVPDDAIAVIVPGKPAYYAAMLDGFANSTLIKLAELKGSPVTGQENRQN